MSPKTHLLNSAALVFAGILDGLCLPVLLWITKKIHPLAVHELIAVLGAVFVVGWVAALLTFQVILRRLANGLANGHGAHDKPPATCGARDTLGPMAPLIYAPASVNAQTAAAAPSMLITVKRLPALTAGTRPLDVSRFAPPSAPRGALPSGTRPLDVSLFAPPSAPRGRRVLVQAIVHDLVALHQDVLDVAAAADPDAVKRGFVALSVEIALDERLSLALEARGLFVENALQTITWRGRTESAQFWVLVPLDCPFDRATVCLRVLRQGVPIGQVGFVLSITNTAIVDPPSQVGSFAHRFHRAFLSYTLADRGEVLKRAQGLQAAGVDFFQDILSLKPGEEWEPRLFDEVGRCDLFLLFWSSAASESNWVMKEVDWALGHRDLGEHRPEIIPVVLEGPPPPEPPERLRNLNFNDPLCYFIAAHHHPPEGAERA